MAAGDQFNLDITASTDEALMMIEFKLSYDKTKVKPVMGAPSATLNLFDTYSVNIKPAGIDDPVVGEVWITAMALTPVAMGDNTLLATIVFEAVETVESDLAVEGLGTPLAADAAMDPVGCSFVSGGLVIKTVEGDLSGDFTVNTYDAFLLFAGTSGGQPLTDSQRMLSDLNSDGVVNMMDALLLYKRTSGQ